MLDDQYGTRRVSFWENNDLPATHDPPRSSQNTSSPPILPSSYILPMPRYSSQVRPQLNTNERQMQTKYQSLPTKTLPSAPKEVKKTK
jgi:hypothetical protein